jgi:hypothetical protein
MSVVRDQPPGHFGLPVRQLPAPGENQLYLLSDNNARLDDCGYSRATVQAQVRYNIEAPSKVTLRIEGPGFPSKPSRPPAPG